MDRAYKAEHCFEPPRAGPVVVGVDGSDSARSAVRWAASEAASHRVPLRIVHAIGIPDFFPGGAISPSTELFHLLERDGDAVLADAQELAAQVAPGISVSAGSTTESPVVSLLDEADNARSIVLGGSGRGAFTGALLGSTTIALAAHAQCPVIAVRGPQQAQETGAVVVGVDGSELSEDALGCAFEQAAFRNARLIAVHAWSEGDSEELFSQSRAEFDWEPVAETESRVLAERLVGWSERYPDVPVERDVRCAKPRQCLLDWSAKADLVVVGSRGRGGFRGMLLGSTSHALLYHAQCPVMVVRPDCATTSQGA